jgi:short-subunit dehydrogenase
MECNTLLTPLKGQAMSFQSRPLEEQVIVITGASSGIGLATAQLAASRGARVVLVARSDEALENIAKQINSQGGQAIAVHCDVASRSEVAAAARKAIEAFGRIDTWINNAGVSIFGRLDQVSEEDARRLFDTNFWGVVNGCMVALSHMRTNANGGSIINVGSEVSEAIIPLQAMYSASKHAVKGYNDGLRVELEEVDEANIAVSLIQPTAVDTPYPQHARNYMDHEAKLPTPMIDPEKVAEAILDTALKPTRARKVGTMASLNTTIAKISPAMGDKLAAKQVDRQHYDERPRHPAGALHHPSATTGVVGQTHGTGGYQHA